MASNLVLHRGPVNVWDTAGHSAMCEAERWTAAAVAGGLVFAGFRRRSVAGLLLATGGAALAWWAAGGAAERRRHRARIVNAWPRTPAVDPVMEASEESFPASDSPSWTPTTASTPVDGMKSPRS